MQRDDRAGGGGGANPRLGLPSQMPQGSRERSEALAQIRRVKFAINYSDMYGDETAIFAHVKLNVNVTPYLPRHGPDGAPPPPLTEAQAVELGIELRPAGVWRHVTMFENQPNVLLFRAERSAFLAARARQFMSHNLDSPSREPAHHDADGCEDDADDDEAWMCVGRRDHVPGATSDGAAITGFSA